MKKEDVPTTIGHTCPDEEGSTPVASQICATAIGCLTEACVPPPSTQWFHGCGVPPVTIGGCQQTAAQTLITNTWFAGCGVPPVTTANVKPQTIHTWFHTCGIPPQTVTCPQPQAGTIGITGWQTCGQAPTCGENTKIAATTYTQIGCTGWEGCTPVRPGRFVGHTGWYTCEDDKNKATCGDKTHFVATTYTQLGCTGYEGCDAKAQIEPTDATVCTQIQCPETQLLGCTTETAPTYTKHVPGCTTVTSPPKNVGVTGWYTCGQQNTATTTVQTTANAQTGVTGWYTCGQQNTATTTVQTTANAQTLTAATVCTQFQCPQTNIPGCTTATGTPNTIGQTGWYTCGHTLATVCTQMQCKTTSPAPQTLSIPLESCDNPTHPTDCGPQPDVRGTIPSVHVVCGQGNTHLIGCTGWYTCGQPNTATKTTVAGPQAATTTVTTLPPYCPENQRTWTTNTQVYVCGTGPAPQAVTTTVQTWMPGCPGGHQAHTLATVCTQFPPCPSPVTVNGPCTIATLPKQCGTGPQIPSVATVCTQFPPCPPKGPYSWQPTCAQPCVVTNNSVGHICCG